MCSVTGKQVQVEGEGKTFSQRRASCYQPRHGVARWVLQIDVQERGLWRTTFYDLAPLPAAWGKSAWRLVKAEAASERAVYDVLLSDKEAEESCSCPWGTYKPNAAPCVHRACLRALIAKGKLPTPAPKTGHNPAALDGKPTSVPATVDAPAAGDDDVRCDGCHLPAADCECELVLAPAEVKPGRKRATPKRAAKSAAKPAAAGAPAARWDDL
jgi:hypothetical protein